MKRLIVALALVASLGMAGHALAMDKKINIFNGAQYDIYTLYLSPTNANDWEENLLKQETLPNGDKVDVEVSRTEKAEAWDVKVTNKAGETMTWIGVPLNKAGQITLLPAGKKDARDRVATDNWRRGAPTILKTGSLPPPQTPSLSLPRLSALSNPFCRLSHAGTG